MNNAKRIFPAGLLIGAAWILANPNVSMLDIVPDCIAFGLILYALRHISGFAPYMQEATDNFKKLFYITLLKIPALFIMLTMATQRITITLFSLSFAIVEVFFLLPAFNALFDGFFYLGSRFGCDAALRETPKKPDAIRFMTLLFLIAKHALSTLPDFLFLFEYDPLSGEGFTPTNTQYFFVLVIAFVITLIFGIIWLSYILPYLRGIAEDKGTKDLQSPDKSDLPQRADARLRLALPYWLFAAALCLSVDLIVDQKNLLPDYLAAACFLFLSLFLYRNNRNGNVTVTKDSRAATAIDLAPCLTVLSSLLYLVSTVLFSFFRNRFYSNFSESDLTSYKNTQSSYLPVNEEALAAYLPVNIMAVVSEILFVVCIMLTLHALHRFAKENTKTAPPHTSVEERFLLEETSVERKQSIAFFALACLSALASALHVYLLRFNTKVAMQPGYGDTALYLPKSGAFWLFCLALSLALAVFAVLLASARIRKLFKVNDLERERYASLD